MKNVKIDFDKLLDLYVQHLIEHSIVGSSAPYDTIRHIAYILEKNPDIIKDGKEEVTYKRWGYG